MLLCRDEGDEGVDCKHVQIDHSRQDNGTKPNNALKVGPCSVGLIAKQLHTNSIKWQMLPVTVSVTALRHFRVAF